ncbi:Membrane-associated eicosanoid/glutathione metabolism (MAPEG) protein [Macrophomina phaseolina MS6]|uniref:Membrane-associated eicosanoid/glutathione metabolism (MAPEG) protein n=1 Tax=Macrophomina phaseolina (strain MS6) TaxID=1126212 RepID=K2SRG2_MACPH|nr:Membrane-associated eicosanoid/glutathione metabolism (MAPEG) protein [Macrophomina phaseolina MS6]
MASLLSNLSLSIVAIPAYHLLSIIPHAASISYATKGQPSKWDNRNPRSEALKAGLSKRLDAKQYATYERLEAAHANSMENMPIFIAAIVLGNLAGLHKVEGADGLNWFAGAFLLVRAAYIVVYVANDTQAKSYLRSVLYFIGVGLCWKTLLKAAAQLV